MWITKRLKNNLLTIHTMLFLLVFTSGWAVAATYYVSPVGSDSSSGSATAPFKTIQRAANIANPGDTVIVRNGTYTDTNGDSIVVSLRRRGTPSAWITFKAENKWGAVLDGQNVAGYGWHSKGIDYVRIEDFEIKNLRETAIHLSGGTTNISIYGNKIHDVARRQISCTEGGSAYGKDGIYASYLANNITIDSNLIFNIGRLPGGCDANDWNKDHGLYISAPHTTIINNIFYSCVAGWPITLYSGPSEFHVTIINNTFYGPIAQREGHILISGTYTDILIQNNISHSPKTGFVRSSSSGSSSWVIKNNLVYGASLTSGGFTYTASNNIVGQDPKFVDLAGKDFHLEAGSSAIGRGEGSKAPKLDHDRKIRPTGKICDIGAYEYPPTEK